MPSTSPLFATILLATLTPNLFAAPPANAEVTLTANVLSNIHTNEKEKKVFLIAYEGTPAIHAEFAKILADFYPEKGLDADAAVNLQNQFMARLTYTVEGPLVDKMFKDAQWTVRTMMAVTGAVSERDNKRIFTATKWQPTTFALPARMTEPDKPAITPDQKPLDLKIKDGLSLKCICVPAGKFLMGEPYYQCPHWQEDPPHIVTLTHPYYLAEHPITQEIYEAILGQNPSKLKDPKLPVHNVSCADMYKFCDALSAKTGKKITIPTAAQWEYAARVGMSNPTYAERYKDQNSNAKPVYASPPDVVKSHQPNAWGFYDMHSGWWERVSDGTSVLDHDATTDPHHIPEQDKTEATRAQKHAHMGKGQWTYPISEIEYITSDPGEFRFRIVIEMESETKPTNPAAH